MKKILSFVLVLAMIASMMCVSVSAEDVEADATGTYQVVGDHANGNGDASANGSQSYTVEAKLANAVVNKYAVDILYSVSDITLGGEVVWNTKTLQYEGSLTISTTLNNGTLEPVDYETVTDNEGGKKYSANVQVGAFTVTNYSDLGVSVTIDTTTVGMALTEKATVTPSIDFVDGDDGNLRGAYVANVSGEANSADSVEIEAYVESNDWAHVMAQMGANGNSFTAAKFTISIANASVQAPTEGN